MSLIRRVCRPLALIPILLAGVGCAASSRSGGAADSRAAAGTHAPPSHNDGSRTNRDDSQTQSASISPSDNPASAPATGPAAGKSAAVNAAPPDGLRFRLASGAEVFVPTGLGGAGTVDLVVHFHGVSSVTERELAAAGVRAVLVTVNYRGLSAAYERPMSDPRAFDDLLDQALVELKARGVLTVSGRWRRVCVTAFSAGFGAVRALLAEPRHFARIDAIVLADSLYAGYEEDSEGVKRPSPRNMHGFRRYATAAAIGRKALVVTHTYLEPGTYAGTHETADDLLAFVGGQHRTARGSQDEPSSRAAVEVSPLPIVRREAVGGFAVLRCAGVDGEAHMAHLRNLRVALRLLPLERIPNGEP